MGRLDEENRSELLDWEDEVKEALTDFIDTVATAVHEEGREAPPSAVESATKQALQEDSPVDHIPREELLTIRNAIADNHPFIELDRADEHASEMVIRDAGLEAITEFCKRQALHELRRRELNTERLGEPLESRIYW